MPIRNGLPFLEKCIDSIVEQSISNWELIAVDDRSTDDTVALLERYAARDPRISWYPNPGIGIITALREAFDRSRGDYITRMDADDLMTPHKLDKLRERLINRGPGHLAVGLVRYFSVDGVGPGYRRYADWLNHLTMSEQNFEDIYRECVIPSPCWMVHRSDLIRSGGFDADIYPEDYDLAFRFRSVGLKVVKVPEVIHMWRDHPHRASRNDPHYRDNRFLELKLMWFLRSDYNSEQTLVIWGAGHKGKLIARSLQDSNIPFVWITNNENKIGQDIYGVPLASTADHNFDRLSQVIIAVANPKEQEIIGTLLKSHPKATPFYFC
ncbi:MAG: glycosyltransferase family 2 protein [Bacteroidota bacterium]